MFKSDVAIQSRTSSILWVLPYYLLLISGSIIPSDGNHGLFTFKSLGFVGTLLALGFYAVLHPRLTRNQFNALYGLLLFVTFLGVWTLLGDMRSRTPWESQVDQFKVFLITGFVFAASLYYVYEGLVTPVGIIKTVIYANFVYSLGKVVLVTGHLLGFLNAFDILNMLGLRFMSMGIIGDVSRLQTSVDILTPYLAFFVLQSDSLQMPFPKGFKTLYIPITWLSILLSFSRYLILVGIVGYVLYLLTLKGSRFVKAAAIGLAIALVAVSAIGIDNTALYVQKRFFSTDTALSDLTRLRQIEDVVQEFENYPFLGKGLGSFAESNVRDVELRHSYEVQWAAFLMQFGLVGLACLLIPLGIIIWQFVTPPLSVLRWAFLLLFLLWLLSGFTNPFLISLSSGIIYTLFYLAGMRLKS